MPNAERVTQATPARLVGRWDGVRRYGSKGSTLQLVRIIKEQRERKKTSFENVNRRRRFDVYEVEELFQRQGPATGITHDHHIMLMVYSEAHSN